MYETERGWVLYKQGYRGQFKKQKAKQQQPPPPLSLFSVQLQKSAIITLRFFNTYILLCM